MTAEEIYQKIRERVEASAKAGLYQGLGPKEAFNAMICADNTFRLLVIAHGRAVRGDTQ